MYVQDNSSTQVPEILRTEEVEQVKEFLQVVLKWSACEQQLVLDVVGT